MTLDELKDYLSQGKLWNKNHHGSSILIYGPPPYWSHVLNSLDEVLPPHTVNVTIEEYEKDPAKFILGLNDLYWTKSLDYYEDGGVKVVLHHGVIDLIRDYAILNSDFVMSLIMLFRGKHRKICVVAASHGRIWNYVCSETLFYIFRKRNRTDLIEEALKTKPMNPSSFDGYLIQHDRPIADLFSESSQEAHYDFMKRLEKFTERICPRPKSYFSDDEIDF